MMLVYTVSRKNCRGETGFEPYRFQISDKIIIQAVFLNAVLDITSRTY